MKEPQRLGNLVLSGLLFWTALLFPEQLYAQESSGEAAAQLSLRRSAQSREYNGNQVDGEERRIAAGDSLWRILIRERGLSEKAFSRYLVLMRAVNPHIGSLEILRVGDVLFVPLRPDEVLGLRPATVRGTTIEYRVKYGEHLFGILRRQLGIVNEQDIGAYYSLVKDLNPEKKNWDLLHEGEVLRLPSAGGNATRVVRETKPSRLLAPVDDRAEESPLVRPVLVSTDAHRLQASRHIPVLVRIIESVGVEVLGSGEEVLSLRQGTIRIDRSSYPVFYNRNLEQKIVFDPDNQFPSSLRKQLEEPGLAIPVVSLRAGESLHDGARRMLSHLGYQLLPNERPVSLQVGSVGFRANGNWVALAPEENNKAQEIYVVNLTKQLDELPGYLKAELSLRGLHMQEIPVAGAGTPISAGDHRVSNHWSREVKRWPADIKELVDVLLLTYGVGYGVADTLSIEVRDGLRLDIKSDRTFQTGDRRTAVFFQRLEPEIKTTLQEKNGVRSVELDLATGSRKDIIARLLAELGEKAQYQEHRFALGQREDRATLLLTAPGFLLQSRGLFLTDREIPDFLRRFFFEKGLEIVYFE